MALNAVERRVALVLGVDAKEFEKGIQQASKEITKMSETAYAATKKATLALFGTGGLFAMVGKSAVQANMEIAGLQRSLQMLYGSTEKAASRMKVFHEMALTTPFSMQELVQAQVAMDHFGLSFEKWFPLLGDWATGTKILGTDMLSLIEAMARLEQGGAGANRAFMTFMRSGLSKKVLAEYGVAFDEVNMKLMSSAETAMEGIVRAGQVSSQQTLNSSI